MPAELFFAQLLVSSDVPCKHRRHTSWCFDKVLLEPPSRARHLYSSSSCVWMLWQACTHGNVPHWSPRQLCHGQTHRPIDVWPRHLRLGYPHLTSVHKAHQKYYRLGNGRRMPLSPAAGTLATCSSTSTSSPPRPSWIGDGLYWVPADLQQGNIF